MKVLDLFSGIGGFSTGFEESFMKIKKIPIETLKTPKHGHVVYAGKWWVADEAGVYFLHAPFTYRAGCFGSESECRERCDEFNKKLGKNTAPALVDFAYLETTYCALAQKEALSSDVFNNRGAMKRGNCDFKDHELIIQKNDLVKIYHLQKSGSYIDNIKFINCGGVLSVTGDYGNWIFCREFHPSPEGYVSDGYWIEKLEISSSQEGRKFDSAETLKTIQEGLGGGLVEYGYEGDELEEVTEYYESLLRYVEDTESEYESFAYYNHPDFMDAESVPFERETKYWLKVVFDGFEEICRRLK